jgi:hypothetical protein
MLTYRFSYQEFSTIASYLDHNDLEAYRRVSRAVNYSTCHAIIENLAHFKEQLQVQRHLKAQAFLKESNITVDINKLKDQPKYSFTQEEIN